MPKIPFSSNILFVICFVANIKYGIGVQFLMEKVNGPTVQFGHSPFWYPVTQSWYYTDLLAKPSAPQIFRLDNWTKRVYTATVQDNTGGVAFIVPILGELNRFAVGIDLKVVCVQWDGVSSLASRCGDITSLVADAEKNLLMHYGSGDPFGHLYIKTYNKKLCSDVAKAAIYKVISNGVNKQETPLVKSPSGFVWNKFTNRFYYTDLCVPTITECIWNPLSADISSCRVVYTLQSNIPNAAIHSLAIDRLGNLYFFVFNQGLLYKVSPLTGAVIWTRQLEVSTLIHLAFGGPLLDEVMITTASVVLNPADGTSTSPATLSANAGSAYILRGLKARGFTANGTSTNFIGKPMSPRQVQRNDRPKPEKAVWISRIHRDTTNEELSLYIQKSFGLAAADFVVRKLVKKDCDLATYSFVSFRITCSLVNFSKLMDPKKWPSTTKIREFELERKSSEGARLNQESAENETKNEEQPKNVTMETDQSQPPATPATSVQSPTIV